MHKELHKMKAILGQPFPEPETGEHWYRVDADYGNGELVFVGECNDRSGMLILTDRAFANGAVRTAVYKCERVY